ncbi:hypothetical protein SAMN04488118_10691 [Epibacterium ulvae]|uniref:Uncharacterized protein n=1 Tax=Epibacterium ulvae TaxID=1156985 RepID=A0A1G5QVJ9_9RHOB|nr:hypothetical protein SAMN04488118_10691 [Epibacterium ulvae]
MHNPCSPCTPAVHPLMHPLRLSLPQHSGRLHLVSMTRALHTFEKGTKESSNDKAYKPQKDLGLVVL